MLEFARQRIQAVLAELDRTASSDFPYRDSKDALRSLQRIFANSLKSLEGLDQKSDPDTVVSLCQVALKTITNHLPLIGFIVRSTATRNAFEAFGPFRRLAGDLLEPHIPVEKRTIKLVFSSEWQYQPFIYDPVAQLEDFLLIGLPASESSNPLLLPLAGHELGHALWSRQGLQRELNPTVRERVMAGVRAVWSEWIKEFPSFCSIEPDKVETQINAPSLLTAFEWCARQCEELFCDLVGLAVFGTSFYNAFAYTLSPGLSEPRSPKYPDMRARVDRLCEAGKTFGSEPPQRFATSIAVSQGPMFTPSDHLLLKVAEQASAAVWPRLLEKARELTAGVHVAPDQRRLDRIVARFRLVSPAEKVEHLAEIFNAAWMAYDDETMWKDFPAVYKDRHDNLKDLVLKNLEIFEIERRLA